MADIKKVILDEDDFGHELRVGSVFENVTMPPFGFEQVRIFSPQHGGTYTDQVTGKTRQFDYRCRISREDGHQNIFLAVECKNINPDLPVVICGRPRSVGESCHMMLYCNPGHVNFYHSKEFTGFDCLYKPDEFVGKSIIRLKTRQGNLCSEGDSEVYDRWAQAMSSCYDLCNHAFDGCSEGPMCQAFVMPVVVLPDGSLWKANYDEKGMLREDPSKVDSCEYYIDQQIQVLGLKDFSITHVHFVTLAGLSKMLEHFVAARTRAWKTIFGVQSA